MLYLSFKSALRWRRMGGAIVLAGCASMGPPGGGPEDREPPVVIAVTPTSGSTAVSPNQPIRLVFSEPVDARTVEAALFITPTPARPPKVKVRGREAVIRPAELIPADRTLVLALGTGVADLHGNRMAQTYTVAVTAGESIDQGRLEGLVFSSEPVQGMLVGAWAADDTGAVHPGRAPAPWMTQVNHDGTFALEYLPEGVYRLLCWEDRDRDRLWDPAIDRLGVAWGEVRLGEGMVAQTGFYPIKRDTGAAAVLMVSVPDNRHISVKFDRALSAAAKRLDHWKARDEQGGRLELGAVWFDPSDSAKLVFLTDLQEEGKEYILERARDRTEYRFRGAETADTIAPWVTAWIPPPAARDLPPAPEGRLLFDEALSVWEGKVRLIQFPDSMLLPVEVETQTPNEVFWRAKSPAAFGCRLRLECELGGVTDHSGNARGDTVATVEYYVVDPAQTGSVSGVVVGGEGKVAVRIRSIGARRPDRSSLVGSGGEFAVELLPPGRYLVWAFEDRDGDGEYDFGGLEPWEWSERFAVSPDTVEVRARWETAGVRIQFR